MVEWQTDIGGTGTREFFKNLYGGETNSGIQTPANGANLLCYSDPAVGEKYGYHRDGWNEDKTVFHYTGQGAYGDQVYKGKNQILAEQGSGARPVRLFVASGYVEGSRTRIHTYVGEFTVDPHNPYVVERGTDGEGRWRRVFIFRLLPVGQTLTRDMPESGVSQLPESEATYQNVPLANHTSSNYEIPPYDGVTAKKREEALVEAFIGFLNEHGITANRLKIYPHGSRNPLFSDLCDPQNGVLYEAKASVTRPVIREALGQILDYRRFVGDGMTCRLLLPEEPSVDLLELLDLYDIEVVYPNEHGFSLVRKGRREMLAL